MQKPTQKPSKKASNSGSAVRTRFSGVSTQTPIPAWIVRKTTQDPENEPTQSATTAEQSGPHDDAQLSLPELAPAVPQLTPTPGPSNKLAASPRPGAYVNTHIGKPENVMEPLSPIPTTEAMHKPNKKPNKKPSKKLDKKPTHLPPNEKTYTLQSRKCTP